MAPCGRTRPTPEECESRCGRAAFVGDERTITGAVVTLMLGPSEPIIRLLVGDAGRDGANVADRGRGGGSARSVPGSSALRRGVAPGVTRALTTIGAGDMDREGVPINDGAGDVGRIISLRGKGGGGIVGRFDSACRDNGWLLAVRSVFGLAGAATTGDDPSTGEPTDSVGLSTALLARTGRNGDRGRIDDGLPLASGRELGSVHVRAEGGVDMASGAVASSGGRVDEFDRRARASPGRVGPVGALRSRSASAGTAAKVMMPAHLEGSAPLRPLTRRSFACRRERSNSNVPGAGERRRSFATHATLERQVQLRSRAFEDWSVGSREIKGMELRVYANLLGCAPAPRDCGLAMRRSACSCVLTGDLRACLPSAPSAL